MIVALRGNSKVVLLRGDAWGAVSQIVEACDFPDTAVTGWNRCASVSQQGNPGCFKIVFVEGTVVVARDSVRRHTGIGGRHAECCKDPDRFIGIVPA
jgi:hypothetical protein